MSRLLPLFDLYLHSYKIIKCEIALLGTVPTSIRIDCWQSISIALLVLKFATVGCATAVVATASSAVVLKEILGTRSYACKQNLYECFWFLFSLTFELFRRSTLRYTFFLTPSRS